jgi:serine phosphatase RsbU (regulator of sigma subunit)
MKMNGANTYSEQKFTRVLRDDIKNVKFQKDVRREFKELKSFYITEEQNKRLAGMNNLQKGIYIFIWMIKSLFLHLTPLRRILTTAGLLIILFGSGIIVNDGNTQINNTGLVGGAIIFIVLMLELKDKLLAKDELEAGRKVQRALMPEKNPKVDGWSIWLYTRPANEVGGDLVDYLKINGNRIGLAIGDIAGKGLHAALLTAKLQATVRALAADYGSLSGLCNKINDIFCRDSLPSIFASMLYCELEPGKSQIRFVNAGHLPPLLINNNEIKEVEKNNAAIGLIKNFFYKEDVINMEKGEMMVAFSDGVTEARNEYGQFFEKEGLIQLLKRIYNYRFEDIGETIIETVERFIGDAPVYDDLSLIIIKKD